MNSDTMFTAAILLLLVVAIPPMGVWDFRLLVRQSNEGVADARVTFYKGVLKFDWPLTIGFLAWWLLSGNDLNSIGLIPVAEGSQWIAIGAGFLAMLLQVFFLTKISRSAESLTKVKGQLGELSYLAPQTPREIRLFDMVSITAGVCEEILYRGLLLAVLTPTVGTWMAVAISSVIFGLGHLYQGVIGVAKSGLAGLMLGLLTVFSGSLFVAIILHAVIDLASGRMMASAQQLPEPPQA